MPIWTKVLGIGFALLALNASLSFHNIWPTLWVHLRPELSVEAAAILLFVAIRSAWFGAMSMPTRYLIATALLFLVLGRYVDVTAPALYGRPINFYWDAQHIPRVAAMILKDDHAWLVIISMLALTLVAVCLFMGLSYVLAVLSRAVQRPQTRLCLGSLAASVLTLYAIGMASREVATERWFSIPVSWMYVRQLSFAHAALVGHPSDGRFAPGQSLNSDFAQLKGRDAYLIFLESYGEIVFNEATIAQALVPAFKALSESAEKDGWHAVTASYESPTFGGASWLSHATLMTGAWIAEQDKYQLLLTTDRRSLVQHFQDAGYRAVALMPGLKMAWPEGAFYNYDKIWNATALKYRGPTFGWWRIPDQYSLARFYNAEGANNDRQPLFVFFTTITSHMPFIPTPPYQIDWSRLLSSTPYDEDMLLSALDVSLDWDDLRTAYTRAIEYDLHVLGDLLRITAHQKPIIIVLGDHQPPALVAGAGASWLVPVHIFAREEAILQPFIDSGFRRGLRPKGPALGRLDQLHGLILRGFDSGWRKEIYD
ncbi:MAG: hypothetical protein VCB14_04560 [Alphaproteobacteria bacterium]